MSKKKKGKRGYVGKASEEATKEPIKDSITRNSIKGESGLTLLQEDAVDMVLQRDVTGYAYTDIAEYLNIDQSTLWRWRKSKEFNDELLNQTEEVQRNFLHEAYVGMRQILTDPKAKTHNKIKVMEMILRNQGRLKDVKETTHSVEGDSMDKLLDRMKDL